MSNVTDNSMDIAKEMRDADEERRMLETEKGEMEEENRADFLRDEAAEDEDGGHLFAPSSVSPLYRCNVEKKDEI